MSTIIEDNNDIGKQIAYLKVDIEGAEIDCFEDWLETDVLSNVQQIGLEFHVSNRRVKNQIRYWFKRFNQYISHLMDNYSFELIDSEPNKCIGKQEDSQRKYYTFNDVLLSKC